MFGQKPKEEENNQNDLVGSVLGGTSGPVGAQATTPVEPAPAAPAAPAAPVAPVAPTPVEPQVAAPAPVVPTEPVVAVAPVTPAEPVAPAAPEAPVALEPEVNVEAQVDAPVAAEIPLTEPEPVAPATPTQTEAVAVPIPGTEGTPGFGETPTAGVKLSSQDEINSNGFVESQKGEVIGATPPANETKKQPKPLNKFLFVLLILALIAGVAYGVYYFLSVSNRVVLQPQEVVIGVGETVPDDVAFYAKVKRGDVKNCNLDNDQIKSSEIGEYKYTITCIDQTYTGTVKVADINAPKVELKMVAVVINEEVKPEDFIIKCVDRGSDACIYEFANESEVKENLTKAGTYKVTINVSDKAGNVEAHEATLYVTETEAKIYSTFSYGNDLKPESVEGYQATKAHSDVFALDNTLSFMNVAQRIFEYKFTSKEDYEKAAGERLSKLSFGGEEGNAVYNDEKLTIYIQVDLTEEMLKSENNNSFGTTFKELKDLYESKGYVVSNAMKYKID